MMSGDIKYPCIQCEYEASTGEVLASLVQSDNHSFIEKSTENQVKQLDLQ